MQIDEMIAITVSRPMVRMRLLVVLFPEWKIKERTCPFQNGKRGTYKELPKHQVFPAPEAVSSPSCSQTKPGADEGRISGQTFVAN
jgi:hypothetical protein